MKRGLMREPAHDRPLPSTRGQWTGCRPPAHPNRDEGRRQDARIQSASPVQQTSPQPSVSEGGGISVGLRHRRTHRQEIRSGLPCAGQRLPHRRRIHHNSHLRIAQRLGEGRPGRGVVRTSDERTPAALLQPPHRDRRREEDLTIVGDRPRSSRMPPRRTSLGGLSLAFVSNRKRTEFTDENVVLDETTFAQASTRPCHGEVG
jgi:hypothetical protein